MRTEARLASLGDSLLGPIEERVGLGRWERGNLGVVLEAQGLSAARLTFIVLIVWAPKRLRDGRRPPASRISRPLPCLGLDDGLALAG